MSKQHTRESVIAALLKFKTEYKRVPRGRDVDGGIRAAATKLFGSFESATAAALNTPDPAIEVLNDIRTLYKMTGKIPDTDALYKYKTTMSMNIGRFHGHICNALDKAIGRSFCGEILQVIYTLSPIGADQVTAREIEDELNKGGITMATHSVSLHLHELVQQQLVTFGKYDQVSWWKLTPEGRVHVAAAKSH
jgi:hypothetical protein